MTFRFGPCVLDEKTRELTVGAVVHHLTPKAYELLVFLLRERPRAVAKKVLHDRLWPDTFVTDVSLAKLISEIRSAIGDSSESPRWIKTVHRFGYAFIGSAHPSSQLTPHQTPTGGITHWLAWSNRSARLRAGENVVGRGLDVAVRLESPKVSRRHARIVIQEAGATVEDLGSRNGTWVGGKRVVASSPLRPGDRIRIGPFALTYRAVDRAAPTESAT
jgi:DNA-binding winged helix-turn-helix (wHTH) protein